MQRRYEGVQARGAEIVALSVAQPSSIDAVQRSVGAAYVLLADTEHQVAEAYGVYNLLGDGYAMPAVFVIDRDGRIVWSYVSESLGVRPTPDEILSHLP